MGTDYDRSMGVIGYQVDCDYAQCLECFDRDNWTPFEDWTEPVPIFDYDERDTPTHCSTLADDHCGAIIPHALTSEGVAYIRESIARETRTDAGRELLNVWAETYRDDLENR